jgi:hypothetical protein
MHSESPAPNATHRLSSVHADENSFRNSEDVHSGQHLTLLEVVPMNEVLQPKLTKDHSLMRWIIVCCAMLLIALLIGFVPVLFSYRKIMSK